MDPNEGAKELSRTVFDCLSPNCGTALVAAISDILADGLDVIQIVVLATFISSVGDNLAYIAAQRDLNALLATQRNQRCAGAVPPAPK